MLPHHGIPDDKLYVFKSLTERAIDKIVDIEKPKACDLNTLKIIGKIKGRDLGVTRLYEQGVYWHEPLQA